MKPTETIGLRLIVLLGLLTMGWPPLALCAEVYKWIDANGVTHYRKQPPSGIPAERVQLRRTAPTKSARPAETPESIGNRSQQIRGNTQRVVIYTTDWCPVCRRAKAFLGRKGIAYVEYDIEKTAKGRADYRRLNGRGVPIIMIGNRRLDGFQPTALEKLLH